jgi:aspartate aminotransferase
MTSKLARRLDVIAPSMTLQVTAKAQTMRAAGIDVISFSAGEPDFDTPAHIKEAAKRALDAGATKYTAVEGTPALRDAVAAWFAAAHGFPVRREEVMVSAGAKQAVYNAFHALLDEGDEILLPAPFWVSYSEIAKLAGATPVPVSARASENFIVNPDALAAAITPATRAILLVSPSNPTGAVYDRATVQAIADLAVRHDLWLITDDIYRCLCYGGAEFVQPATLGAAVRDRTVIVDGVSKAFAMTGWRIGFTRAPERVIKAMATLQGQSTTNAAAVSQAAALAAITGPTDDLERMRQAFDERRQVMLTALRGMPGVTCVEPRGAFYCFPDVSSFAGKRTPQGRVLDGDPALCDYLLDEAKVAVVPGSAFHAPGYIRLAYATSLPMIAQGLQRIGEALQALR